MNHQHIRSQHLILDALSHIEHFILELVDLAHLDTKTYFFSTIINQKRFLKDCIKHNQVCRYLIKCFQRAGANYKLSMSRLLMPCLAETVIQTLVFRQESACQDQNVDQYLLRNAVVPRCRQSNTQLPAAAARCSLHPGMEFLGRSISSCSPVCPGKRTEQEMALLALNIKIKI